MRLPLSGRSAIGRVLIALLLTTLTLTPQTVNAATSQVSGDGVASLRDCIIEQRRVSAVILVDESQSLRGSQTRPGTDVDATRVDALKSVVGSLALLPGEQGAGVRVDVRVAGFGESFSPASEWRRLDAGTAAELTGVADQFRDRDDAFDTDYVLAMQGALDELDVHAAATSQDGPTCRAVIILSDGEYSLGSSGGSKAYAPGVPLRDLSDRRTAVRAGLQELCRPGGLADRSRATGTVVVGLGLKLATQPSERAELEGIAPLDFFTGLATGSSGNFACGEPQSSRFGAIATADDFGRLAVEVFCILLGGCVDEGNPQIVEIDRSVSKLVVVASSTEPGLAVTFGDPTGASATVGADQTGELPVPGGSVSVARQSDRLATFTLSFDQSLDDQVGTWTVAGAGPGETSLAAAPQTNLRLVIEGEPVWTIGGPGTVAAQLTVADGLPVSPSELSGVIDASLEVVSPSTGEQIAASESQPDDAGRIEVLLDEVPTTSESSFAAQAAVGGELGTATRPGQTDRQPIELRRAGLPSVLVPAGGIRLSGVEGGDGGQAVARGSVEVRGDDDLAGTVCITAVNVAEAPEDASGFSLDGGEQCVDVAAGETTSLDVAIAVEQIRSGEYAGVTSFDLRSPESGEEATVDAPISFAGAAPVCTTVLIGVLVGILVAVLLAALIVLFVVSRFVGRFPRELHQRIQYARLENVTLTLAPNGPVAAPQFDYGQFDRFISDEGVADRGPYSVRDHGQLKARPRLLALPDARMTWPQGPVVGSRDGFLARRRVGRAGALPLGLDGGWAFGVRSVAGTGSDDDPYVVDGELWAFLATGTGQEYRLRRLNSDLVQRLAGASLRAAAARLAGEDRHHDDDDDDDVSPPSQPVPL